MEIRWIKRNWTIALIGIFAGISLACVQNKVAPIMEVLMEHFQVSMSDAGWLSSVFAIMGMVVAVPAALILKKIGAKKSGTISLVFAIVGSVIGLVSADVDILIVSRIIEGFGVGVIAVTVPALISMWFPAEKRGFPMGLWGSWMTSSQALVFFFAGPVVARYGWQGMWMVPLGMCLLASILFFLKVKSPPDEINYAKVRGDDASILEGLESKSSWILAFSACCFTFVCFGFACWIAPQWQKVTGWPMEEVLYWISFLYTIEIGLSWMVGAVLNLKINRKKLAICSFFSYGVVLFICFITTSSSVVLVMIFVYPLLEATTAITIWTIATQTAVRAALLGVAIGILNIGLNLGTMLGQPLTGWAIEHFDSIGGAVLLAGVAFIGSAGLFFVKIYEAESSVAPAASVAA